MFEKFAELVRQIDPDAVLQAMWAMEGGVSAQVTGLEVLRKKTVQKWVVRQHGMGNFGINPHIAVDEFRLLGRLREAGLPVPLPIYVDSEGVVFGSPCVVQHFVEGSTEVASGPKKAPVAEFAAMLARIHQVDTVRYGLEFLPALQTRVESLLSRADDDPALDAIAVLLRRTQPVLRRSSVLLHGDYWLGNVLWNRGKLAAVIDWEDAELGDPLADLGSSRLELLWAFGHELMGHFTAAYLEAMPTSDHAMLPWWDLFAALDKGRRLGGWGLDPANEIRHRALMAWFVENARAGLSDT